MDKSEKWNYRFRHRTMKKAIGGHNNMTGLIYKYTNLLNGKIYIGLTKTSLEERDRKHLSQLNDNTYFHKALKKYGRNNFSLEIIENEIPYEILNEREKYWIKKFDSYYVSNKGYNLTPGGEWGNSYSKLSPSQVEEIQQMIIDCPNKTLTSIGEEYGVSLDIISDINTGKTFINSNLIYPIRQAPTRSDINSENIKIIIDLLQNSTMSMTDIALNLQIKEYTVGEINRGNNSWCPKDLSYPIRKPIQKNTYNNVLNEEKIKEIIYDLIFTSLTQNELANKYGVGKNTIGDISRGASWKAITHQFKCPIKTNKLENLEIYKSLYGIV